MSRIARDGDEAAEDPLLDFFRRFGVPPPVGNPQDGPAAHGTGSGFIVSQDGYILTNAHVVAASDSVTVRLSDRREFAAKVVGSDARTDIAVIKIDASNLPTVPVVRCSTSPAK
jgi:serine protease Do